MVDNDYGSFQTEFADRLDELHKGLKANVYSKTILSIVTAISALISKRLYKPFAKEQGFISEKLEEIIAAPKNTLTDVSLWLDIIVYIKKYKFLDVKNEIFGYIYENYLKELYGDENKGQYFTDPAVVNYMLREVGYERDAISQRWAKSGYAPKSVPLSICDPSCGSGTFLYSAANAIIEATYTGTRDSSRLIEEVLANALFGLDIEEFPLYLAEMGILMRMLPLILSETYNNPVDRKIKVFKTNDSIAEFANSGISALTFGEKQQKSGQLDLFDEKALDLGYESYVRDEGDLREMKISVRPPRRRFDFVVGNPPYVGYNVSSKAGVLFTKLIKSGQMSMASMYGVNLNTVPGRNKPYSPKPNLYSFFLALGLALLKEDGKLAYIIPQTLLTANDLDVLRFHLAKYTTIEKIITFAGKMFVGRGLKGKRPVPTSSLILIVRRKMPSKTHKVSVFNYPPYTESGGAFIDFQSYLDAEPTVQRQVSQAELLEKVANWNHLTKDASFTKFHNAYVKGSIPIDEYRNSLCHYDHIRFDKGLIFPKSDINTTGKGWRLVEKNKDGLRIGLRDEYILESHIRIPEGSQGVELFRNKFKILWSYMNFDKFYFADAPVMVDPNWILISSNDKLEILFLLALLNSAVSTRLVRDLLANENEQAILLGIRVTKEFVRIPRDTAPNRKTRKRIIDLMEKRLEREDIVLKDIADFSGVGIRKFDSARVDGKRLILNAGGREYIVKIKLSENALALLVGSYAGGKEKKYELDELKFSPVPQSDDDYEAKQTLELLVFAMYFDIDVNGKGNLDDLQESCKKSSHYKWVFAE